MCYEYFRSRRTGAEEKLADQRKMERLEKNRSPKPVPAQDEPVMSQEEQEAVEA